MHNYAKWIVSLALAAPLAVTPAFANPTNAEDHPQDTVQMNDLPAAVQKTVQREAKGKTIESMRKDTANGKTVYQVELVSDGKGQQIDVSETGKVINRHTPHDEKAETDHK